MLAAPNRRVDEISNAKNIKNVAVENGPDKSVGDVLTSVADSFPAVTKPLQSALKADSKAKSKVDKTDNDAIKNIPKADAETEVDAIADFKADTEVDVKADATGKNSSKLGSRNNSKLDYNKSNSVESVKSKKNSKSVKDKDSTSDSIESAEKNKLSSKKESYGKKHRRHRKRHSDNEEIPLCQFSNGHIVHEHHGHHHGHHGHHHHESKYRLLVIKANNISDR